MSKSIVNEVLEYLGAKAAHKAIEWAHGVKVLAGKYPSAEEILKKKAEYYNAMLEKLKAFFKEVD